MTGGIVARICPQIAMTALVCRSDPYKFVEVPGVLKLPGCSLPEFLRNHGWHGGPGLRWRRIALVFSMGGGLDSHIRSKRSSMHGLAIVLAGLWLDAFWEPARLQGAADLLRWQGRRTEAIACLDQASLLMPAGTTCNCGVGVCYTHRGVRLKPERRMLWYFL